MTEQSPRRPAAFRLDSPDVLIETELLRDPVRPGQEVLAPAEAALARPRRRRFPWVSLFWSAVGGLVSLGASLAIVRLIEDLFARNTWLGWIGLGLATLAGFALLVIIARETIGLMRLAAVESLRRQAADALARDDRDRARLLVKELIAYSRGAPRLARGRAALEQHVRDIIDGADLVRLAERELMPSVDQEARQLVAAAAKRVSLVTAVSPRAAVDMAFVLFTAVRLIRSLAELYGGRPGLLGLIRLVRETLTHLAVTGGMAAGDSLIQQMLGHGVAAKLSARLGEGVLNGLLTARLGLAAIEVTRPLPFVALPAPTMTDLAGGLIRRPANARESAAAELSSPG